MGTDRIVLCRHLVRAFKIAHLNRPAIRDSVDSDGDLSAESMRWKGEDEIEAPEWWNNLDATKNIGYPVRDEGRYGSHPSHDGFDDESEP